MNLYLEGGNDNGTYKLKDGTPVFRVTTPSTWFSSPVATIERAAPNPRGGEPIFTQLAEIEFHDFHSTKIRWGGVEYKDSDVFTAKGLGGLTDWARNRVFTGKDGIEYNWKLGRKVSELRLNEDTDTTVALFHVERFGILHDECPAYLEIKPIGMHMVDMIFISYIYVEQLRNDRKNSYKAQKAGGKIGDAIATASG